MTSPDVASPSQTHLSSPGWTWAAAVATTLLVVVEKPWALFHAQLWAEDGSVHLLDNEMFGASAFFHPYRGYLHLLPRMIAWLASRTVGVQHWPIFYNCAALVVAFGVFARMASRRIELPSKPWLVLAFGLAAGTGEVFLNITNLHWLTSFLILQQVLIAPPDRVHQWVTDFVILPVIGLTGPFIAVFMPLFLWRWWRERSTYSLAVLLVAGVCAGIQSYLVVTTGPHYFAQSEHFNLEMLSGVVGSRWIVWPLFGPAIALALPLWALAMIGVLVIALLAATAVRRGPYRIASLQILAAFVLIGTVCAYRIRPDGWHEANLDLGDSYFFDARVMAMWLLILNFTARPAYIAWTARALCACGVLLNLSNLIEPVPGDFDWAYLCDPIRTGAPAKIPTLPEDWILQYPGREIYVELSQGWYGLERGSSGVWQWTAGKGDVAVTSRYGQNIDLHFGLRAKTPETISIFRDGVEVWKTSLNDQDLHTYSLAIPIHNVGTSKLVFSSNRSGVAEAPEAGARLLSFAIYNWLATPTVASGDRP